MAGAGYAAITEYGGTQAGRDQALQKYEECPNAHRTRELECERDVDQLDG